VFSLSEGHHTGFCERTSAAVGVAVARSAKADEANITGQQLENSPVSQGRSVQGAMHGESQPYGAYKSAGVPWCGAMAYAISRQWTINACKEARQDPSTTAPPLSPLSPRARRVRRCNHP